MRQLVAELKASWKLKQAAKGGWIISGSKFAGVVPFFYFAIDKLMKLANEFNADGIVKKTIVMEAISELYDVLIGPLVPIYLKPFAGKIKSLVVDTMISSLIDFLVAKVKEVKIEVSSKV